MKYLILFLLLFLFSNCFVFKKNVDNELLVKQNHENFIVSFSEANRNQLLGNYTKSLELYEQSIVLQPESAASYYQISRIYSEKEEYSQALFYASKSIEINSENLWYIDNYANILFFNNEIDKALEQHELLLSKATDIIWYYKISDFYMNNNYLSNSLEILNLAETKYQDSTLYQRKINIFKNQNLYDNANNEYKKLIKKYSHCKNIVIETIVFQLENNFLNDIVSSLKILSTNFSNSSEYLFLSTYYNILNGDCKHFDDNFNLNFSSVYIDNSLKIKYLDLITNSNCINLNDLELLYFSFYEQNPDDKEVLVSYFKFLNNNGLTSKQEVVVNTLISKGISDLDLIYEISDILLSNEKYAELVEFSKKNLEIYPNQPEIYLYTGISYFYLKNFSDANKYLKSGKNLIINNKKLSETFDEYLNKIH